MLVHIINKYVTTRMPKRHDSPPQKPVQLIRYHQSMNRQAALLWRKPPHATPFGNANKPGLSCRCQILWEHRKWASCQPCEPPCRCDLGGGLDCQQPEAALGHTQAVIGGGRHTLHAPGRVSGRVGVVGRRLAAAWLAVKGAECCRKDWCCRLVQAEGEPQSRWLLHFCRLLEDVQLEGEGARSWHALQQRQLGRAAWIHLQTIEEHE